jgi:hypothetical protein
MAIATDDGCAGQREALFGADDVDDALALVEFIEVFDAEVAGVLGQRFDLGPALDIIDAVRAIFSGACTLRPAMRRPSKACGLVTS